MMGLCCDTVPTNNIGTSDTDKDTDGVNKVETLKRWTTEKQAVTHAERMEEENTII